MRVISIQMVFEAWGLGKTILTLCKQRRKPEEWRCGAVGSGVGPVRTEEQPKRWEENEKHGCLQTWGRAYFKGGEFYQVQLVGEANEA